MANGKRIAISVLVLVLLGGGACLSTGCGGGGSGGRSAATFVGNVASVSGGTAKATSSPTIYAWFKHLIVADAVAQSNCPARHVIACIDYLSSNNDINTACSRVSSGSCTFAIDVALARSDDSVEIFFHDDVDGDGQDNADGGADSNIVDSIHPVCNGDVVRISNVSIDFNGGQAFADSFHKDRDACGSGTVSQPGPKPSPTSPLPIL